MKFQLIEPLRELFKDEVRNVGYELGLDRMLVDRHPFPGPGLGVRIIGEITLERVKILQIQIRFILIYCTRIICTMIFGKLLQF